MEHQVAPRTRMEDLPSEAGMFTGNWAAPGSLVRPLFLLEPNLEGNSRPARLPSISTSSCGQASGQSSVAVNPVRHRVQRQTKQIMKNTENRSGTPQESIVELSLNTRRCTRRLLASPKPTLLSLAKGQHASVPGMPGFVCTVEKLGDAALFHVAHGRKRLMSGVVVWGKSDLLFCWLVGQCIAQLPGTVNGVTTLPLMQHLPWSAHVVYPRIARFSRAKRCRLHQFRRHLIAPLIPHRPLIH